MTMTLMSSVSTLVSVSTLTTSVSMSSDFKSVFRIEIGRLDAFLLLSRISQVTYFPLSGGIWLQVRLIYEKEALEVLVSEVDLDPKIWVRILLSSLFENFRAFLTFIRVDTFSRTFRIAWHKTYYTSYYQYLHKFFRSRTVIIKLVSSLAAQLSFHF